MHRTRLMVLVAAILFAAGLTWSHPPQATGEAPPRNAVLPSEALRFGAALEGQASVELKKWVQGYVAKQMREQPVNPKGTMAAVDERFPRASDEARDALTFLAFYSAYRDEEAEQKMLSIRIRHIDRETIELTRQIQQIWKDEDNRSVTPGRTLTMQQRMAIEQEVQKREAMLREYADERQLKSTRLAASRKKVDLYLKLLALAHERMTGIEPAILRSVKTE